MATLIEILRKYLSPLRWQKLVMYAQLAMQGRYREILWRLSRYRYALFTFLAVIALVGPWVLPEMDELTQPMMGKTRQAILSRAQDHQVQYSERRAI